MMAQTSQGFQSLQSCEHNLWKLMIFTKTRTVTQAVNMRGSRGGGGGGGGPDPPPLKSQKYGVSWQYWSGSPNMIKLPSQRSGHHHFKLYLCGHMIFPTMWLMLLVCATSKASDQPAHMCCLIRAFASRLSSLWLLSYWPNSIWSF